MKQKMVGITVTLLLVICTAIALTVVTNNPAYVVRDYTDCVNAGYPVLESYPPQCTTSNGRTYIQQFDNEKRRPRELPKERSWGEAMALIRTCQVRATAFLKEGTLLMLLQDDSNISIDSYNANEFQEIREEAKQRCNYEIAIAQ